MAKRPSLIIDNELDAAAPKGARKRKADPPRPPSREGKRVVSIYIDPAAWKQLKRLAIDREESVQSLGEIALNLLFERHRLSRIA